MWWMLLLALEGDIYRAEIVVRTQAQCELLKTGAEDMCVPVTVQFAEPVNNHAPTS
jgi:hypothetical protein